MIVCHLRRIFIILFLIVSVFAVKAQQLHFVYLQTENSQPFYVKMNNKVISSSPEGYVILSNLTDSSYQIIIGFPKNEFPEQAFQISVDNKNEGFLVKNFGEKGWGLFNMQTLALLPATNPATTVVADNATVSAVAPVNTGADPFSQMLATVIKDSSLLQNNSPVTRVKDSASQMAAADTAEMQAPLLQDQVAESQEPAAVDQSAVSIQKLLTENDKEGMQMVYVDSNEGSKDTVRVFIPATEIQNPPESFIKPEDSAGVSENSAQAPAAAPDTSFLTITPTVVNHDKDADADTATVANNATETIIGDATTLDTESTQKNDDTLKTENSPTPEKTEEPSATVAMPEETKDPSEVQAGKNEIIVLPKAVTSSNVNSDCKNFATDEDFLKLRKKMAAENSKEDMIKVAKKVFRSTCFSTEQIKNLSYLFLTDEGKYMFFDTAYAFASNSDQYQQLASQLTDAYYINRFNAMIHK